MKKFWQYLQVLGWAANYAFLAMLTYVFCAAAVWRISFAVSPYWQMLFIKDAFISDDKLAMHFVLAVAILICTMPIICTIYWCATQMQRESNAEIAARHALLRAGGCLRRERCWMPELKSIIAAQTKILLKINAVVMVFAILVVQVVSHSLWPGALIAPTPFAPHQSEPN